MAKMARSSRTGICRGWRLKGEPHFVDVLDDVSEAGEGDSGPMVLYAVLAKIELTNITKFTRSDKPQKRLSYG
jgi:hypothetical protein